MNSFLVNGLAVGAGFCVGDFLLSGQVGFLVGA